MQGFGLLQRDRDFSHYQDIDLAYQLRPSYWVTAKTKLGEGHVELFEMPTTDESNDNVVASWVAADKPPVGKPLEYGYSITSALDFDGLTTFGKAINTFQTSARALGSNEPNSPTMRRFIIDFAHGDLAYYQHDPSLVKIDASSSTGKIVRAYTQPNPFIDGIRATFDVELAPGETADLRAYLHDGPNVLTETWVFPWTAPGTPPVPAPARLPPPRRISRRNSDADPFSPCRRRWCEAPDEGSSPPPRRISSRRRGPLIRASGTFSRKGRRQIPV